MITPKIHSQTELILFDASGTLIDVIGSVGEIYVRFAGNYPSNGNIIHDPIAVQQDFAKHFRAAPPLAFQNFSSNDELFRLEKIWWKNIVRKVFPDFDPQNFDNFFDDVYECFATKSAWKLFDDVIPTLMRLKEEGIKLAVLSNFDSRLERLLEDLEVEHYFDAIHYSSRIGFSKPDKQIFQYALNYHDAPPHKVIHVGDRIREDIEGALSADITPILIDRENKYLDIMNRIYSLKELRRM